MGFSAIFQRDFQWFSVDFQVAEDGTQSKMQLCVKCKDLVKVLILRSGVVFTFEVGMEHVDRRWKAYLVGNRGKSPKSEHGAAKC